MAGRSGARLRLDRQSPHPLLRRLADARRRTDSLFRMLRPEALRERPITARHRLIFYLGHLEAFDWNILGKGTLRLESFHPDFDRLFAFGIDPLDDELPSEPASFWPEQDVIAAYNRAVRRRLDARLGAALDADSSSAENAAWVTNAAIEHRLMHAETCVYMLRDLPLQQLLAPRLEPPASGAPPPRRRVEIPAGRTTLGRARARAAFGWDNEFEEHAVDVPAFEMDVHPVTNGDFIRFVAAGGYEEPRFWSAADWHWKVRLGLTHPRRWIRDGDTWRFRALFSEMRLPQDWPAYVSHAEACAYARWAGLSLPTETQWQRAALCTPDGRERSYPWGDEPPGASRGNFDFHSWDPQPVTAHPAGASAFGVHDLLGNGWEWTSTPFAPFPGFRKDDFYPGYSAAFFDGRHFVLKGGGPRTAACMLRRSFRNWFQAHYPYVDAKVRLVAN
ncbi:MAG: ergothioneine biosynthesis protein EgtB [Planctomycetota bacterium]|nr:MAG: ergothioneine biosynthesis protein EgtB [Planctomycetota bacterium]